MLWVRDLLSKEELFLIGQLLRLLVQQTFLHLKSRRIDGLKCSQIYL